MEVDYIEDTKDINISDKKYKNIEKLLVDKLIKEKLTISTAESITGGLIASSIVNVAGASDVFEEGYITYSDKVKSKVLNINKNIIDKYTAVSVEVCKEMLINLKKLTNTDTVIVSTGYAGPGENAGLVYVGINYKDEYIIKKLFFTGSRNEIREKVVKKAIHELYETIK